MGLLDANLDAEVIGRCDNSDGRVTVCVQGGIERPLLPGNSLHIGDRIQTGENSVVSLHFEDGTKIDAGAHSALLIDVFAIESDSESGIRFTLSFGSFVIESGNQVAGPDGFVVDVGDTALGLRMARIAVRVDPLGYDLVSLLPSQQSPAGEVLAYNKIATQIMDHTYQTLRLSGEDDDIPAPLTLPSCVVRETFSSAGLSHALFAGDAALDEDYSENFQPFHTLADRFLERQFITRQVFPSDGPVITGDNDRFLEDAFDGTRFRLSDPDAEPSV